VSEWISVTERLPEEGQFIFSRHGWMPGLTVPLDIKWNYRKDTSDSKTMTHWINMTPAPSKERA